MGALTRTIAGRRRVPSMANGLAPPGDEVEHERDERDHKQQVDQAPADVSGKADEPQHEKESR